MEKDKLNINTDKEYITCDELMKFTIFLTKNSPSTEEMLEANDRFSKMCKERS